MSGRRVCLFCDHFPVGSVFDGGQLPLCEAHAREWIREEATYLGTEVPLIPFDDSSSDEEPMPHPSERCTFCGRPARAQSDDGKVAACRTCAIQKLSRLLADAVGVKSGEPRSIHLDEDGALLSIGTGPAPTRSGRPRRQPLKPLGPVPQMAGGVRLSNTGPAQPDQRVVRAYAHTNAERFGLVRTGA
jgi:hypothetical protein